jgi:hypothetical protein
MPLGVEVAANFAEAMKGKKTVAGLHDAVDTELARAKIAANAVADRIGINLQVLAKDGAGFDFLFADLPQVCTKANDDFALLVKSRIADHQQREHAKAEAAAAAGIAAAHARSQSQTAPGPATPPTVVPLRVMPPMGRPTDDAIIAAVASHFTVSLALARQWLASMDFLSAAE